MKNFASSSLTYSKSTCGFFMIVLWTRGWDSSVNTAPRDTGIVPLFQAAETAVCCRLFCSVGWAEADGFMALYRGGMALCSYRALAPGEPESVPSVEWPADLSLRALAQSRAVCPSARGAGLCQHPSVGACITGSRQTHSRT